MAIKKQKVREYVDGYIKTLGRGETDWIPFLDSAAFTYKYRFANQLAIYLQRPDAAACASMEKWNQLGRKIKGGSKGIRLFERDRYSTSIYVFDMKDTKSYSRRGQNIILWGLDDASRDAVEEYINETYDVNTEESLADKIAEAAEMTATEQFVAYVDELVDSRPELCTSAFSDALDKAYTIAKSSARYIVLKRCGFSCSSFTEEDFDFGGIGHGIKNSREFMLSIGGIIQSSSEDVLRGIERQVKMSLVREKTLEYNKEKELERKKEEKDHGTELQESREPLDTGLRGSTAAGGQNRQVRPDEGRIPVRGEADDLLDDEHRGDAETASAGDRGAGAGDEGNPDEQNEETPGDHGTDESPEPGGLGESDGNDTERSGIYRGTGTYQELKELSGDRDIPYLYDDEIINPLIESFVGYADESREEIYRNFEDHYDFQMLGDYLKQIADDAYTEILIGEEQLRAGYKAFKDGLLVYRDGYGNRSEEALLSWRTTAEYVESLRLSELESGAYVQQQEQMSLFVPERPASAATFGESLSDRLLRLGSNIEGCKSRIHQYFTEPGHSMNEKAEYLKNEYGTGMRSHVLSGSSLWLEYDYKGIRATRKGEAVISLPWNQAAKQIDRLIENGTYLYLSELLDLGDKGITRSDDTLTIGGGEDYTEVDISVTDRQWETIQELIPEEGREPAAISESAPEQTDGGEAAKGNKVYVVVEYSEHPAFYQDVEEGRATYSLPYINRVLHVLDRSRAAAYRADPDNVSLMGYDKTQLHLHVDLDGRSYTVSDRYDIGTEDGSLIEHFAGMEDMKELMPFLKEQSEASLTREEEIKLGAVLDLQEKLLKEAASVSNLPEIGTTFEWDGRRYRVEEIADDNTVSLLDMTFADSAGFPIYRSEPASRVADILAEINKGQNEDLEEDNGKGRPTSPPETKIPENRNFVLTDYDLGKGSRQEKFRANIQAVETLKQVEQVDRAATPEEQEILSRYTGWGGLPEAFDEGKKLNDELKALLSEEEYKAARESVLNAHYTQPLVIEKMYDIFDNLGFCGGNLLEPAMGVGNFFGKMPDRFKSSTRLHGVELDDISGRIAKQLYPDAHIQIKGFEETEYNDDYFDAAIGNVPFGDYGINDRRYNNHGFLIHDYFFAKTLDKVRPGGVIAFITSSGTLDKKNSSVRRYIAERAELLGAVRLPNTAFKENAGTEVTSDILVLQKREQKIVVDEAEAWLASGTDQSGLTYNQYFIDHPEMVIGKMQEISGRFGPENACILENTDEFEQRLDEAVRHIQGSITEVTFFDEIEDMSEILPADPKLPDYAYSIVNDRLYYRENSRMIPADLNQTAEMRARGMIVIRDSVRELIRMQLEDDPEEEIKKAQENLLKVYTEFTDKFGLINSRGNSLAFREDSGYPLICSLESIDDEGNLEKLADIFYKRTARAAEVITETETASEALAVSLSEKGEVDLQYMAGLCAMTEDDVIEELKGVIYRIPDVQNLESRRYVTADEYLSGNVRDKLAAAKLAAASDKEFEENVAALEKVIPEWLDASRIAIRLGSVWVPADIYTDFIHELLETPDYAKERIEARYSEITGAWHVSNKGSNRFNVLADTTYGTKRASAYRIIDDALNLRTVNITDTVTDADGNKRQVPNLKETALANQKQDLIKEKFTSWVWEDIDRRERLEEIYNIRFNSCVARKFDGGHLRFPGMNLAIKLKPYQKGAVARQLYGQNALLAHCVGSGKTFEIAAAVMEKKRIGLCHKAMIVVPGHLTGQWSREFMALYPTARLLAVTNKDFTPANRKRFCSRIATGDYDAVIISHSQFEKIPLSKPRQKAFLESQLDDIQNEIKALKEEENGTFSVKQLVSMEKKLRVKLEKLNEGGMKDNTVTFEELGVDFLCVDEAHGYKNLALQSKMRNVAGISATGADKSYDMFAKCRYIDEITNGRGLTFATGTPVSNSMTELYTMQRYLQYDRLKSLGVLTFDAWASTYGETATVWELAPEGTRYKQRTRFARFFNLPELMSVFKDVADIQTADMINLDVPEAVQETVIIPPTARQMEILREIGKRADRIRNGDIDPTVDNMLKVTTDGRKLALDERILTGEKAHPLGKTKADACIENAYRIYEETKEKHSAQLIFCDISTPKNDGSFTVYDEIRNGLMERGVPEKEIAFIHDYNTETQKEELFSKVRQGKVRFLMGSTQKMGAGMNVQNKMIAAHHLDVPWRPADLEQQDGRIIRQGNENEKVYIYRYVTENTFDAYSWQILESKQKYISQIMTSKSPARSCDDIDETALGYAETKALCTGNPLIKEKMELENDLNQLRMLKNNYESERFRMEERLYRQLPAVYKETGEKLELLKHDAASYAERKEEPFSIALLGVGFTDRAAAGATIFELAAKYKDRDTWEPIGEYRGFELAVKYYDGRYRMRLKDAGRYHADRGGEPSRITDKLDELLDNLGPCADETKTELQELEKQLDNTEKQLQKPFAYEDELKEKEVRLLELQGILEREEGMADEEQDDVAYEESAYEADGYYLDLKAAEKTAEYRLYDSDFELSDEGILITEGRTPDEIADDVFMDHDIPIRTISFPKLSWLKEKIRNAEELQEEEWEM